VVNRWSASDLLSLKTVLVFLTSRAFESLVRYIARPTISEVLFSYRRGSLTRDAAPS